MFCIMLQNYVKVFIRGAILVPVPGQEAPDFINTLLTIKSVKRWLKECYNGSETRTFEIGQNHVFWAYFMTLHQRVIAAGGWVRNEAGELLVIERNGKLDMPKGKLESKETVEVCAVREVQEECHVKQCKITGPAVCTYHCYLNRGGYTLKTTYWYPMLTNYSKKLKPQIDEGITAVYWATPELLKERMAELPTYNSLTETFEKFIEEA